MKTDYKIVWAPILLADMTMAALLMQNFSAMKTCHTTRF